MNKLWIGIIIAGMIITGIFYIIFIEEKPVTSVLKNDLFTIVTIEEKSWVETHPISCVNYTNQMQGCYIHWLTSYYNITKIQPSLIPDYSQLSFKKNSEYLKDYYKKQGIDIFDVKYNHLQDGVGEFGESWDRYSLQLLVSNSTVQKITDLGFTISSTNMP